LYEVRSQQGFGEADDGSALGKLTAPTQTHSYDKQHLLRRCGFLLCFFTLRIAIYLEEHFPMSLFGEEEPSPAIAKQSRSSLFDEPSPAGSNLFDDDVPGNSPWGMPTPKKAARGDLIRSLLPASDVPDSYIDIFDDVAQGADNVGGKMSVNGIAKVLSAASLGADEQSRIVSIISSGGQLTELGRNEFNVLLALIGLAQEHEDITLDGVDERRRSKQPTSREKPLLLTALQVCPNPGFQA
jgi:hypothetical protein